MSIFSRMNKYPFLLGIASILFFLAVSFGVGVKTSNAALLGFGGRILWVMPCPCSGNLAIAIGPPRGGIYSFGPGSIPYAWYQIFHPGPWALGSYVPGNACLWFIPFGCAGFPTMGTMINVGTSMF